MLDPVMAGINYYYVLFDYFAHFSRIQLKKFFSAFKLLHEFFPFDKTASYQLTFLGNFLFSTL